MNDIDYNDGFINTEHKQKKQRHILRNSIIVLCILLVIVGAFFIWAVVAASSTANLSKLDAVPDNALFESLCKSVLYGEEQEITNNELNSFLAYTFEEYEKHHKINQQENIKTPKVSIESIAIYFHKETPCEVYAKMVYSDRVLIFSALADIRLDSANNAFSLEISDAKIGDLPVPSEWILSYLFQNEAVNSYTDKLSLSGTTVTAPSYIEQEFLGQTLTFKIKSLVIKEARASVLTTSATDLIGEFFGSLF